MSARLAAALVGVTLLAVLPAPAAADPPPNDARTAPEILAELPARVNGTTVDATSEADDPGSRCAGSRNSVYYQFRAGADGRVVIRLQAEGDLDAVVDVYRRNRSQLTGISCEATDETGAASVGASVTDGTVYLIRVAQLNNSVSGTFSLQVDRAQPDARFPGTALPAGGRRDTVDRILNPTDAWTVRLRTGVTYRVNLSAPVTDRVRCVRLTIFGPRARSFRAAPIERSGCGGYFLITPRPGRSGRYSLLVEAERGRGSLPYSVEVAPAGDDDTAPGLFLRNLASVSGELSGNRVDRVDLYRFDVAKRSALNLRLSTRARFDLVLLSSGGRRLSCSCSGDGDQSIQRRVNPGRYFVAVRAQTFAAGRYRLTRVSRAITSTRLLVNGARGAVEPPGSTVRLGVRVTPGASGPMTLLIERFDPLAGWLFVSLTNTRISGGVRTIPFRPPTVGRWRARARFLGTRTASPSRSGYARVLIASPLAE